MANNAIARLVVELAASTAQFQTDLGRAAKTAEGAAKRIGVAFSFLKGAAAGITGAISVSAFVGLVKGSIDAADHLNDLSQQTGVAVETLSGLGLVAKQSGTDLDSVAKAFGKLNLQIAAGAAGNEEALRTFKAVGLSVADLQKLSPEEIFARIADRFAEWNDGANKAAIGSKLFGKAYQEIIPTLNSGGDALRRSAEYAKKYGGVTTEVAQRADEFNDTIVKLQFLNQAFSRTLSAELLPSLQAIAEAFVDTKEKGDQLGGFARDVVAVLRGIATVAVYVTTEISALGHALGAIAAEARMIAHLDFAAAGRIEDEATKDQEERFKRRDRLLAAINNPPAATITGKGKGKPKTEPPGLTSTDAQDTAKKILDGQIKALEDSIREEEDTLRDREHFLQTYYQDGYLSTQDYYDRRQQVISAAIAAEVQAYQQEQAALEAFRDNNRTSDKDRIDAETKIAEVKAKRARAEQSAAVKSVDLFFDSTRAAKQFREQIEASAVALADLRGDKVTAVAAGFDLATQSFRDLINLQKQSTDEEARRLAEIAERDLDVRKKLTVQQAQLNDETSKFGIILDQVSNAQARISIAHNSGAITELDALRQLSDANAAMVPTLRERLAVMEAIKDKTPEQIQAIDNMRLKIEELAAAGDLVAKKFNDLFAGALTDALTEFASGTKSFKDAIKDLEKSIVGSINRIAAQNISEQIFGKGGPGSFLGDFFSKMFGGKGGGAGGGDGISVPGIGGGTFTFGGKGGSGLEGILGGAGGAGLTAAGTTLTAAGTTMTTAGSLLTAAAASLEAAASALLASSSSSALSGAGSLFGGGGFGTGSDFGNMDFGGFFANGGSPPIGKAVMVGERGRELFVPRSAGTIVPNHKLGGNHQTIHINVSVPNGTSTASAGQIAAQTAREFRRATARYN